MKKVLLIYQAMFMVTITSILILVSCTNEPDDNDINEETSLSGRFVFVSRDDGDAEIYTVNADGTDLQKLTNNQVNDIQPAWSPDGSKIVYNSYGSNSFGQTILSELFVMNADGSGKIQITHDSYESIYGEAWPSWSPDGARIIYESYRDALREDNGTTILNANLYISNSNGSGDDTRNTSHQFFEGEPSWSPEGNKIAFVHARIENIQQTLYSSGYQIWIKDVNGSTWQKLTTGDNNLRPKWSPDGTKIVYQSDAGICIVNLEGVSQQLVDYGGNPAWSPDGKKIVFDGDDEIYVMNADGTNIRKIGLTVGARQVMWKD